MSVGRNDPGPCNSGRKYKQCCMEADARRRHSPQLMGAPAEGESATGLSGLSVEQRRELLGAARVASLSCTVLLSGLLGCDRTGAEAASRAADMGTVAVDTTTVVATPTVVPTRRSVALDGNGLMRVDSATGSTRPLRFGDDATGVLAAVTASLGAPLARTTNAECALEVVSFDRGLLVNVQKDRFVGWTVRASEGSAMGTMSGIGLGSTRSALQDAYTATVRKTTIGVEFSAGGLSGLLTSDTQRATITDLWAGINCIAR